MPSASVNATPLVSAASTVPEPSASPAVAPPPAEGPAWLASEFDPQKALPLRVAIAELGSVYPSDSGLPMNSPSGARVDLRTFALEEPADKKAERIHVLCDDAKTRVALYLDRKDLATVARKGAALSPSGDLDTKSAGAKTPGLTFSPGTVVALDTSAASGTAKVRVRTPQLEADGFGAADSFDQVYEAESPMPRIAVDSELPHGGDFYDKPGGKRFAKLLPRKPEDPHYFTEKVGDPERGMVFVRADTSAGTLAGWVAVGALAAHGFQEEKRSTPGVIGLGTTGTTVMLEQRTFLGRGDPPVRIGVTLQQNRYACRSQCKGGMPVVLVDGCGARFELASEKVIPGRSTIKKR